MKTIYLNFSLKILIAISNYAFNVQLFKNEVVYIPEVNSISSNSVSKEIHNVFSNNRNNNVWNMPVYVGSYLSYVLYIEMKDDL